MELVCVEDFEQRADAKLEKNAKDYYKSGAGDQFSLKLNREAFKRFLIQILSLDSMIKTHTCTDCVCVRVA